MKEREALLDRMIQIYGLENSIVIEFAKLVENPDFQTEYLEILVKAHEEFPQYNED